MRELQQFCIERLQIQQQTLLLGTRSYGHLNSLI
jgi:hypothetical protein